MKKLRSRVRYARKTKNLVHRIKNIAVVLLFGTAVCLVMKYWCAENRGSFSFDKETRSGKVGEPPYKIIVDAGHGGSDPGACGVIEEKTMTTATAEALWAWLEQDPNYIPLGSRENFDTNATPAERARKSVEQTPDLLISIHGNAAANDQTVKGFECYPTVPGRKWHEESLAFAKILASGMNEAGANLRGYGGVRYIYYTENDKKQIIEITHNEVRMERSFTILEEVNCPAVLVEQCFVTNVEDVERFGNDEGCETAARVYYEAICTFFETEPLSKN